MHRISVFQINISKLLRAYNATEVYCIYKYFQTVILEEGGEILKNVQKWASWSLLSIGCSKDILGSAAFSIGGHNMPIELPRLLSTPQPQHKEYLTWAVSLRVHDACCGERQVKCTYLVDHRTKR